MDVLNLNLIEGRGLPEGAVYVGRPHVGRGLPGSKFANPFPVGRSVPDELRSQSLEKYRHWLWAEIQANRITLSEIKALDGHDLACFCAPKACHGMIVKQAVEWARGLPLQVDVKTLENPLTLPAVRSLSDWLKVRTRP